MAAAVGKPWQIDPRGDGLLYLEDVVPPPPVGYTPITTVNISTTVKARYGDAGGGNNGADIWAGDWLSDGDFYSSWGDGKGFNSTLQDRRSWGFAKVVGSNVTNLTGNEVLANGNVNGKSHSVVGISDILYTVIQAQSPEGDWTQGWCLRSEDFGVTWLDVTGTPWNSGTPFFFNESDGITCQAFVNYGQNYAGGGAYLYALDYRKGPTRAPIYCFRVPVAQIQNRSAWECYTGTGWSTNFSNKATVLDTGTLGWGLSIQHHPWTSSYLMTLRSGTNSNLQVWQAPEPWGPWTQIQNIGSYIDNNEKFTYHFPAKWTSGDGKTIQMIFSGVNGGGKIYDALNFAEVTLDW